MDLSALKQIVDDHLRLELATALGTAKPPYSPGVYALFFERQRVYIGIARGKKGLRNRKRNYVGGDDGHTMHRELLSIIPDKTQRTAFITSNVLMAWYEVETAKIAEELEKELVSIHKPNWNRLIYLSP
ncbi:MAG: hypothetical protein R3E44_08500 [Paracoccaceae bacterium]